MPITERYFKKYGKYVKDEQERISLKGIAVLVLYLPFYLPALILESRMEKEAFWEDWRKQIKEAEERLEWEATYGRIPLPPNASREANHQG